MNDEQLEKRLVQLLRETGMSEDVLWRAYARGQLKLLRKLAKEEAPPVAGFPFSWLERGLRALLGLVERMVAQAVTVLLARRQR